MNNFREAKETLLKKQAGPLSATETVQFLNFHKQMSTLPSSQGGAKSLSLNETTERLQRPLPESSIFNDWMTNACQRTDKRHLKSESAKQSSSHSARLLNTILTELNHS